jgi:superfamily II DNA or RNA helicase
MNHDPRIEIKGTNALIIRTEQAEQLAQTLPESALINGNMIAVRWTLDNVNRLALAGFDPPSPFRFRYAWEGIIPYEHQRRTSEFITAHLRCGIWNEQGTGKTHSAIAAIVYLIQREKVRRVLVTCPKSVMHTAWVADFHAGAPHLRIAVAYGSRSKRLAAVASDADIVIVNYDGLGVIDEAIKNDGRFDLIVADEANAFKNPSTARFKHLAKMIRPDTRMVLMTGTPASQSPVDAYGLAKLLGTAPRTKQEWIDRVMFQASRFTWLPKPEAADHVKAVLNPSIRFTKAECLDLPERTYMDLEAEMSSEQTKLYDTVRKEMLAMVQEERIVAVNAAALLSKLLQISGGVVYAADKTPVELNFDTRYETLRDVIDGTEHKVLVFAAFRSVINKLQEKLSMSGIECEVIDGKTTMNERNAAIFRFQNGPTLRVLVIQPQAAAHGITLTAADTVVWWGPASSVEYYKQANDRVHRIGQVNKVTVYHIVSSAAERKAFKLLRSNIAMNDFILDLFSDIARG